MRRALRTVILAVLLAVSGSIEAASAAASPSTATATGNLIVLLSRDRQIAQTASRAVDATVARLGGEPAGFSVPQIGLITVRPPLGIGPQAFSAILRHVPGVASVELEHRYVPRAVPDDPALSASDPYSGVVQWTLAREGFYSAWDISRGDGALVGVIDTGIDANHPELASKIAVAVDQQQRSDAQGTARTDEVGHGTHVSSLACAATNNGIGMAGAGYDCRLVVEKSDFTDSSVAAAIVDATERHVQALNMSFGPSSPNPGPPPDSEVRALDFAASHKVVLVAAAADTPTTNQGDPADVLQPSGTGRFLGRGIGLDITAAQYNGARAGFAGYGSEISMAAFGALNPAASGPAGIGGPPPGIFGAFPKNLTQLELLPAPCGCRTTFGGSPDYGYLQGTSIAVPQVTAVAAMMRVLNPFATVEDVIRTLKWTAERARGTHWTQDLGWGILDAGRALDAIRRLDPPISSLVAPRFATRRTFQVRWTAHDRRWPGLIASPIARYQVFVSIDGGRSRRLADTRRNQLLFHAQPGHRYLFSVIAIDRAGNRERHPARATTRVARNAR
jgi:subtilisin family serine protease